MYQTFFSSIVGIGTLGLSAEHRCRVIVVNTLSLMTALLAAIMGSCIFMFTGDIGLLIAAWLEAILFSGFILLNYFRKDGVSRIGFMLIHNLAVLYFGVCRGLIVETELLMVFLVLVSLLVFNHLRQSVLWGLLSVILVFAAKINQRTGFYTIDPLDQHLFHALGTAAILTMIFVAICFYKKYWILLHSALDETNRGLAQQTIQLKKINEDLDKTCSDIRKFTQMFCHDVRDELFRHQGLSAAVIGAMEEQFNVLKPIAETADEDKPLASTVDVPGLLTTIQTLHDIGNNVDGLIRNALDLRKIDAGTFATTDLESISVREWCMEVLRTPRYAAGKKGIAIELLTLPGIPQYLLTSRILLERALKNLLSNAVKFSPENGRVILCLHTDGTNILMDVIDRGPGIKAEDIDRIFQLYVTDGEGVGLGLYIALNAVRHLNGEIQVNPNGNKVGSVFRISLPIIPCGECHPPLNNRPDATQLLRGASILVVDDNHLNRMLLSMAVQRLGCVHMMAGSGKECLDIVRHTPPDLILLDARMPEMSGLETLKALRYNKDTRVAGIPVLIVTADEFVVLEDGYKELSNGFLYKPYTVEAMEAALITALVKTDVH